MDSNLDEKRRQLFELHKAKIGTDAPLMRKPVVVNTVIERKIKEPKEPKGPGEPTTRKDKIKYTIIGVTGAIVIIELLFLAREAGWFRL